MLLTTVKKPVFTITAKRGGGGGGGGGSLGSERGESMILVKNFSH